MKDVKSATIVGGSDSTFETFANWNDRGNYDRAVVVSDLSTVNLPSNPTHPENWMNLRYQKWNGESWQTVGAVPSTWYDCSSWGYFYTLNGQQYWGYKEGTAGRIKKEEDEITVLAVKGSTATQKFAFDIDMEDYS